MASSIIVLGAVALIAAICGGGIVMAGVEVPLIGSLSRQVALAVFGIALLLTGVMLDPSTRRSVFRAATPAEPASISTKGDCSPVISDSRTNNIDVKCGKP